MVSSSGTSCTSGETEKVGERGKSIESEEEFLLCSGLTRNRAGTSFRAGCFRMAPVRIDSGAGEAGSHIRPSGCGMRSAGGSGLSAAFFSATRPSTNALKVSSSAKNFNMFSRMFA